MSKKHPFKASLYPPMSITVPKGITKAQQRMLGSRLMTCICCLILRAMWLSVSSSLERISPPSRDQLFQVKQAQHVASMPFGDFEDYREWNTETYLKLSLSEQVGQTKSHYFFQANTKADKGWHYCKSLLSPQIFINLVQLTFPHYMLIYEFYSFISLIKEYC